MCLKRGGMSPLATRTPPVARNRLPLITQLRTFRTELGKTACDLERPFGLSTVQSPNRLSKPKRSRHIDQSQSSVTNATADVVMISRTVMLGSGVDTIGPEVRADAT